MATARKDLLVDLASSNVAPDPADVARWASNESVFVSSLITDMPDERAAVRQAITEFGARPVMFEHDLGAQDVSAERAYLDGLAGSTIYLGIFGTRYGQPLANGYSATEDEFRHAESGNHRMALYVVDPFDDPHGRQKDFVGGVRARYTTAGYRDPAQLKDRVADRLRTMAAEALIPWVILGEAAFRAASIRVEGSAITVRAVIREKRVAGLLNASANARAEVSFAGPHDSARVRVNGITSESTSSASQTLEVSLVRVNEPPRWQRMSVNGRNPEDVFLDALRGGVFGEAISDSYFGLVHVEDPFAPLRGRQFPDFVARSLARVLLDEALRQQGVPEGTHHFILGPAGMGGRQLHFSWNPPRIYINEPAAPEQRVEGVVQGF